MSKDNIEYREFVDGDEQDILDLFNHVFKKNWLLSHWTWENQANPRRSTYFMLALNDAKLVGQSASVPLLFNHEGRIVRTVRVQNVMVHEKFRGKGIFTETLDGLEQVVKRDGEDFIITFPNDNSLKAFINLRYNHLFDIFSYSLSINLLKNDVNQDLRFEFEKEARFNQRDFEFIHSQLRRFKIFNQRNLDYLNWRYNSGSTNTYSVTRVFRGEKQVGLVVSTPYLDDKSIELVEFFIDGDRNTIGSRISAVLNKVLASYGKSSMRSFKVWSEEHYPTHQALVDLGFKKLMPTHVVYKILSKEASQSCNKKSSYYLSMGDSDVY